MKEILIIGTGGTIGSVATENNRVLGKDSVNKSKRLLVENFAKSESVFAKHASLLVDGDFPTERATLSENMTLDKLSYVIKFIRGKDLNSYDGVIVLHGTDTLAYTSAIFSFVFCDVDIPIILVSGNRPPQDAQSNATANFSTAVELIWQGLAPNVYAVYKNGNGDMVLHLGNNLMQCENFSEDFHGASREKSFVICENAKSVFDKCKGYSARRNKEILDTKKIENLSKNVLFIQPYLGLDYSIFKKTLKKFKAVVHGTYHSGTTCYPETNVKNAKEYSKNSIGYLAKICKKRKIPLFIAPSALNADQYETMTAVRQNVTNHLLNTTSETAYAKLLVALSTPFLPHQIEEYILTEVNNEFN